MSAKRKRPTESDLYVSRVYTNVNAKKSPDYYTYESYKPKWSRPDPYYVIRQIGRGKYGTVFLGERKETKEPVVLKFLRPTRKRRIRREIKVLRNLMAGGSAAAAASAPRGRGAGGADTKVPPSKGAGVDTLSSAGAATVASSSVDAAGPNAGKSGSVHPGAEYIIGLYDIVMDPKSRIKCLVFEWVDACDFRTLFPALSEFQMAWYSHALLEALDYCHSKGIIHRDVKPHNMVIDHRRRVIRLIDWGLAEFYHPGTEYSVRVASRHYKAPELLVGIRTYDYSLDIWSWACVLAGMVFMRHPFFYGSDDTDQLVKIMKVLGSADLMLYTLKYPSRPPKDLFKNMVTHFQRLDLRQVAAKQRQLAGIATRNAIEVLDAALMYDHRLRPSARRLSSFPYYAAVREVKEGLASPDTARAAEAQRTLDRLWGSDDIECLRHASHVNRGAAAAGAAGAQASGQAVSVTADAKLKPGGDA